jgi:succinoglycan biosynthesis protein ExoV
MPHFESLGWGAWQAAASVAGVRLIDPRGDPAAIIAAIGGCRVLLSEALHGGIVADALRVPWLALRPLMPIHRAKWQDWAATLDLRIAFHPLAASSLPELLHASPLAAYRSGRSLLDRSAATLRRIARERFIERAARALGRAAAATPQLSEPASLERCRTRMLDRIEALRTHPMRAA